MRSRNRRQYQCPIECQTPSLPRYPCRCRRTLASCSRGGAKFWFFFLCSNFFFFLFLFFSCSLQFAFHFVPPVDVRPADGTPPRSQSTIVYFCLRYVRATLRYAFTGPAAPLL